MTRPTKEVLEQFAVLYKPDTDFSASARLLQSKWRLKKNIPAGKLGNYIETERAKEKKENYFTDNIKNLVVSEINNTRTTKGLINEARVWTNLLSSQPLCFNLFGELHYDLDLATKYFKKLFPTRVDKITAIKFEHSAGRGNIDYTGDHSAFDVFVEYEKNEKKGFIGIEVKYAESLREEAKKKAAETFVKHEKEYIRLTTDNIFKPNAIEFLKQVPLSQIWRDHLLSLAHRKDYEEGFFVFLFPKANNECQKGVDSYINQLISDSEEQTGFYPRHLDDFILTLKQLHSADWTNELEERYLGITNTKKNN